MKRREVFALLGGAAAALLLRPGAARAQQGSYLRTIGVIINYAESDPEGEARFSALRDRLGQLGWTDGHNVQIEVRWAAGRPDLMLIYATQLVSQPADIIVAQSTPVLTVLNKLTDTIPIVFTQVGDPLGRALSPTTHGPAAISPDLPIWNRPSPENGWKFSRKWRRRSVA